MATGGTAGALDEKSSMTAIRSRGGPGKLHPPCPTHDVCEPWSTEAKTNLIRRVQKWLRICTKAR